LLFVGDAKSVTFIGMKQTDELKSLLDEYRVPGFKTMARVRQDEKDPTGFALTLVRRQKKHSAVAVERYIAAFTLDDSDACGTSIVESAPFISILSYDALIANGAA
jgi:sugar/nucleoside kinase (ribokinase family)